MRRHKENAIEKGIKGKYRHVKFILVNSVELPFGPLHCFRILHDLRSIRWSGNLVCIRFPAPTIYIKWQLRGAPSIDRNQITRAPGNFPFPQFANGVSRIDESTAMGLLD